MPASATLVLRILADSKDASDALGATGDSAGKLERAALPAAAALGAVVAAGYGAAQSASDLAESQNKVAVVFGDAAGEMDAWASTAATSMGMSKQAALDAAGSMGTLFTQLGFASSESADMSQAMVGLSADLASFHNLSGGAAEATDMMSAAMRGEYDSIQRVIPTLNAAAVEQRALADTGKTSASALTDAEKAAATYALIMEGAGPAVGDFANTSDSAANQQRILSATLADATAALGAAFLPALQAVVPLLTSAASWAGQNTTALAVLAGVVGVASAAILALNTAAKVYTSVATLAQSATLKATAAWVAETATKVANVAITTAMTAAALAYTAAQKIAQAASKAWTAVQWLLNAALTANPIGLVVAAVAALVAGFVIAYKKSEAFREVIDSVWNALKTAWEWVKKLIDRLGDLHFPSPPSWLGKLMPGGNMAAPALAPTVRAGAPVSSSSSGGIVVNISGALDPDAVARQLRRVLATHDRRTGAAYAVMG